MQRPVELGREPVGQHLHVAGEHDELGPGRLDQRPERRLLLELGLAASPAGGGRARPEGRRGRRSRPGGWRPRRPCPSAARRCASGRAGRPGSGRTARPGSSPGAGRARSRSVQLMPKRSAMGAKRLADARRWSAGPCDRVEHHAHEEAVGLAVVVLLGVEDVAAPRRSSSDGGDDAGPVRAGEGEDVVRISHGTGVPLAAAECAAPGDASAWRQATSARVVAPPLSSRHTGDRQAVTAPASAARCRSASPGPSRG